ncbi:DUF4124 domain-containing protein [Geoanaerobacter pelophilus]|nr:DUF4124 domain-containing protein [Geoanaerobacter pelophilus]
MKTRLMLLALTLTASAAAAEMYTWKDSKGTTFYTNSLHEIPARYVKRARVLDVATGKKGGPALEHPGTPAAPVAGGASPQQQTPPLVQSAVPLPAAPASAPVAAPAPAAPSSAVSAAPQQRSQVGRQRAPRRQRGSGEE